MSNIIIPSSPKDLARIKGAMEEVSNSFTRMEAERSFIREAINELSDEVDIPKKILNKMSRVFHKQNMAEVLGEIEDVEALLESI
jgi:hypothetical protein|tara:strand:+ start:943 stop:1197 length:255 start_codon:yes stop_codon:yes gene_type:complete